jgi:hypothetical protein
MRDNGAEDVISMNRACGYGCVNYIINSVVGCHDEAASGGYIVLMHLMAMLMESVFDSFSGSGTKSQLFDLLASLHGSLSRDKRRFDWRHRERSRSVFIDARSVRDRLSAEPGFSDFSDRDLVYSMLRSLFESSDQELHETSDGEYLRRG